jgi:hypothetical protein
MIRGNCKQFYSVRRSAIAAAIVVWVAGPASATEVDVGNPDLARRWAKAVTGVCIPVVGRVPSP